MRTWLRWALLGAFVLVLTPLSATTARADDPVTCVSLMPVNATLIRLPDTVRAARCVIRDDFTVHGSRYRVAEMEGARTRDLTAQVAAIREATERSAAYYGRWFRTVDTTIVIGALHAREEAAEASSDGFRNGCVISLENAAHHAGRTLDRNDLMRTIAHELFHCIQLTDPDLHNVPVKWRDEGTAEYFSGLVIPDAPYNSAYSDDLPRLLDQPLYELDESAGAFIFYFGNARSPEAVANFLQGAVHDTSAAGSVASLRNIPDIDQLFHSFVQAWIEQELVDPNGRRIAVPARDFLDAPRITSAQRLDLGAARSFMATAHAYELADGVTWALEGADDGVRGSWRRAEDEWLPLTATIESCDRERTGLLLLTSTAATTEASPRAAEAVERAAAAGGASRCQCPVGTWRMSTEAIQASGFRGMFDGPLVSGTVSVTFNADGSALGTYEDLTWDNAIDRTSSMRAVLYGFISWRWRARPWDPAMAPEPVAPGQQGVMVERTVSVTDASWRVEFWARGRRLSERVTPFNPSGGSVNLVVAYCDSDTLLLRPNNGVMVEAPPPWTGIYHRAP